MSIDLGREGFRDLVFDAAKGSKEACPSILAAKGSATQHGPGKSGSFILVSIDLGREGFRDVKRLGLAQME